MPVNGRAHPGYRDKTLILTWLKEQFSTRSIFRHRSAKSASAAPAYEFKTWESACFPAADSLGRRQAWGGKRSLFPRPRLEIEMRDPVEPLILDLLEWIGDSPKPYRDVMEVWRTSCPRLPVWEEANLRGYLAHLQQPGGFGRVAVSDTGLAHLRNCRHTPASTSTPVSGRPVAGKSKR